MNPGNRIPSIPRQIFKFRGELRASEKFSAAVNVQAFSRQFARGDENNRDANGQDPGYAVLNLDASYRLARNWELFAKVDNLLDQRDQKRRAALTPTR